MEMKFIGWCKQEEENHDKVWGLGLYRSGKYSWLPGTYVAFWGRRGKKLQQKSTEMTESDALKLICSKIKKGYVQVDKEHLDDVYETFGRDVFKVALKAK